MSGPPRAAALLALGATILLACSPPLPPETSSSAREGSATIKTYAPRFDVGVPMHLRAGEFHDFPIDLAAGEAIRIEARQEGVDLVLEWRTPPDATTLAVDSPIGAFGPELLCFVAPRSGTYHLRIRALTSQASGNYRARLQSPRSATASDRACFRAAVALAEAEALRSRKDSDASEILKKYDRVISGWREAQLPHPLAVALIQAGHFEIELGALAKGQRTFEEALALARSLGDIRLEASVHNRLGLIYHEVGEISHARRFLETALSLARQLRDPRQEASALSNLGLLAQSRGRQHDAIALFEQALALAPSIEDPLEESTFLLNLGISQTRLAAFDKALSSLGSAFTLARARPQNRPERIRAAEIQIEMAWIHHLLDNSEEAVSLLRRALGGHRSVGFRAGEAVALDRLGTILREQGNHDAALMAYRESQIILRNAGNFRDLAYTRANIGWLFESWGRPAQARTELLRSLAFFEKIGDRASQAHALAGLARANRARGRLKEARDNIEKALTLVEGLQIEGGRKGDRFRSIPVWQGYQDFYIDLLIDLHGEEPQAGHDLHAFEVSDEGRARGLYEMLLESQIDLRDGLPQDLLEREEVVRARLAALEDRLMGLRARGAPPARLLPLERQFSLHHDDLERVQMAIRSSSARFTDLRRPQALPVERIQALIEPGTSLLSYVLGENNSYLFLLTDTDLRAHRLPPRRELEAAAITYWNGVSDRAGARGPLEKQIRVVATQLSELLLGPVAAALEGKRLIVIADGALHYVPFAALPIPDAETRLQPLVRRYEVIHLPSVAVIDALRNRQADRPRPAGHIAVIADPVFEAPRGEKDTHSTPRWKEETPYRPLSPLPHTRSEAEGILHKAGSHNSLLALGNDATAALVKSGSLGQFEILHIASHGFIDEDNPQLSGIILSMVDAAGDPIDGFLSLSEIYNLDLPAQLVVLSGCRTALGRYVRGVGLLGLTRGFFFAGATRLLVSLWDVNDEATALLMDHFYEALLVERLPPPAALRQAQLHLMSDPQWASPYFWAGFVLQGDFAPLS